MRFEITSLTDSVANSSGRYIKADLASVTAAAAHVADKMPDDFRISITDAPGERFLSYIEFHVDIGAVDRSRTAKTRRDCGILRWGLTQGQGFLDGLSYARLPDTVIAKEQSVIDRIKAPTTNTAASR